MRKEKTTRYLKAFLKISIAILAIWVLFKTGKLTKESFIKLFQVNNIPFILLSSLAFLSCQLLIASRLVLLLRTIGLHLQFLRGFKLIMIGNFFNIVIPGTVGGDLVKGYYLIKEEKNSKGRSSGIIAMDRVIGFSAVVFFCGVSVIYLLQQNSINLSSYYRELYFTFVAISALFSLFAVFLVFGRHPRIREKLKTIFVRIFRSSIFYYMVDSVGILLKKRRIIVYSFLISILIQLISLAGLLILMKITSKDLPDLITLLAVSSIVMLFGIIPVTPGNIGWIELIAAFGWSAVGSNDGAEVFFYWRVVTVCCSLSGLYLFMAKRRELELKYRESL